MHPIVMGLLAIDITRQREREAFEAFRAVQAAQAVERHRAPARPSVGRRWLARLAALVSRRAGDVAVRLDRHVDVDLATPSHRA